MIFALPAARIAHAKMARSAALARASRDAVMGYAAGLRTGRDVLPIVQSQWIQAP
jgi:hypothetical protein